MEDKDQKANRLHKQVKDKLSYKQDMVSKEGKGKYNLTVPIPYEFQKEERKRNKSIR